ncbi:MAG: IS1 family transposase, partial [Candidatus Bathyarchaeota archaeon]|nr:IS1 family transposase [Candidatus Termiticorpusculum sp.]
QRIERKHLTFRTRLKRLARKTICYSKSLEYAHNSLWLAHKCTGIWT